MSLSNNTDVFRRVTDKQYYTLFQSLYQAIMAFSDSYYQAILAYSELISNSINSPAELLPNNSKDFFESLSGHLNRMEIKVTTIY